MSWRDVRAIRALVAVTECYFNARPRSTWSARTFESNRSMFEEALDAARALGDPMALISIWVINGYFALVIGDAERHRSCVAAVSAFGAIAVRPAFLMDQSLAMREGRLVEAEALSLEQFESWRTGGMTAEAVTYRATQQFGVRREQGRLGEVTSGWDATAQGAGPAGAAAAGAASHARLERPCRRRGDAPAPHGPNGFRDIPDEAGWPLAVAMWAEVAVGVHDTRGCRGAARAARAVRRSGHRYGGHFVRSRGAASWHSSRMSSMCRTMSIPTSQTR